MAIITHLCCFCTWVMNDCSIKCSYFLPQGLVNHYLINKNFKQGPFSLIGQSFSPKEWLNRENNVFVAAMVVSKQGIWMETYRGCKSWTQKMSLFGFTYPKSVCSHCRQSRKDWIEQRRKSRDPWQCHWAALVRAVLCSPSLVLGFTADASIKIRNLKITLRLT